MSVRRGKCVYFIKLTIFGFYSQSCKKKLELRGAKIGDFLAPEIGDFLALKPGIFWRLKLGIFWH
jgi:hypothetical protein